jgi:hypothetical protein
MSSRIAIKAINDIQSYSTLPVDGTRIIGCVAYHDDGSSTPVPIFVVSNDCPKRVFAIYWRIISYHLDQGDWRFVHEKGLFGPFESSLGKLKPETHSDEVATYREFFNAVVSRYNNIKDSA